MSSSRFTDDIPILIIPYDCPFLHCPDTVLSLACVYVCACSSTFQKDYLELLSLSFSLSLYSINMSFLLTLSVAA